MSNKHSDKANWWERLKSLMKTHTSLSVIVVAALLMEISTAVMYYASQHIIMGTVEMLIKSEMKAISYNIHNRLGKVEHTLDNMAWVATNHLEHPDSLFSITRQLVEHHKAIVGSRISCVPNLFPQRGRLFEPYAVRRPDGTIASMQLGSASHDYTKEPFFTESIARDGGYWCEPYMDSLGARTMVTSYAVPVHDRNGQAVAVLNADLSLDWLDGVINEGKIYQSAHRLLLTGNHHLLAGEDSLLCTAFLEQTRGKELGNFTQKDDHGREKHVFYAQIGGKADWLLLCVVDDSEVFGRLRRVQLFLLTIVLAGFVLLGLIVWRTSRNLERLRKLNAEKERITAELRVASKIQQSMLPRSHLKQEDVEIFGSLTPAREVGGDLFDYFIRDAKLFFCIGDVSGKGTPSALFMASTRSQLRSFSARQNNPAQIMYDVNEAACQGNDTNMFVTLFIGVLDLPTGHLCYCDAGHDAPFIAEGDQWTMLDVRPHLPVGLFEKTNYGVQETWLKPDSTLFLYTDGLTEAMNGGHEQFSLKRVKSVIEKCTDTQPEELLKAVSDAVHDFVGEAEQSDDLTMLAIRYTPRQSGHTPSETLTARQEPQGG